jgi:hypothetical protein
VTYAVPDSAAKKTLRVVAGDLKSVIETVEKTIPGATVVGAPVGQPVDAIAANVVPADVHVSPMPANQPGLHPFVMGPNGPMPMMAGGQLQSHGP